MKTANEIEQTVSNALAGCSEFYLEDIVSHGIHSLTNDYHGDNSHEYDAIANEFESQAEEALKKIADVRESEYYREA